MVRTKDTNIREKIVATAKELFYKNGYRATGINEVIKKSGVAKATFYSHFPSKEDLCLAYVKKLAATDWAESEDYLSQIKNPKKRFLAIVERLEVWLKDNDFKGCGFLNLIPEITDKKSMIRKEINGHYDEMRVYIEDTLTQIKNEDKKKYKDLDPKIKAKEFMVIFTGSIALSEIYGDTWPVKSAAAQVKEMIT